MDVLAHGKRNLYTMGGFDDRLSGHRHRLLLPDSKHTYPRYNNVFSKKVSILSALLTEETCFCLAQKKTLHMNN